MMINKDNIMYELQKLIETLETIVKSDALKSDKMRQISM